VEEPKWTFHFVTTEKAEEKEEKEEKNQSKDVNALAIGDILFEVGF
jgi:hypothetical protein